MTDLSLKKTSRTAEKKEAEEPVGVVILMLLPFAGLFWWLLTQAFLHGIY